MKRHILDIIIIISFFACYEIAFISGARDQMLTDQKKLAQCHQIINKDLYGNVD